MTKDQIEGILNAIDPNKRLVLVDSMDWIQKTGIPAMIILENNMLNDRDGRMKLLLDLQFLQHICDKLPDNTLMFIETVRIQRVGTYIYFHYGKIRDATPFLLNREIN